jgi:hypothetical protein
LTGKKAGSKKSNNMYCIHLNLLNYQKLAGRVTSLSPKPLRNFLFYSLGVFFLAASCTFFVPSISSFWWAIRIWVFCFQTSHRLSAWVTPSLAGTLHYITE